MQVDQTTIDLFKKAFENITPVIKNTGTQIILQNSPNSKRIRITKTLSTQTRGFGYSR